LWLARFERWAIEVKDVMENIIKISIDLFMKNGFKATTTRQIISEAKIRNGTLYYYFKNKDDILKYILVDAFDKIKKRTEKLLFNEKNLVMHFSLQIALTLKIVDKDSRVADLYTEAYRSWLIMERLLPDLVEQSEKSFQEYVPEMTKEEHYTRALAILGCMYGFIAEGHYDKHIDFEKKVYVLLDMVLSSFGIGKKEREEFTKKSLFILSQLKDDEIELFL
jgi:AcrR family transcriptional regulator